MEAIKDVIKKIKTAVPSMSKSHKQIAKYIIDNYDKAAFMTACKLASATGVSESTVVRFAMSLGYDGYPEFQVDLRDIVMSKLTNIQRMEITDDLVKGNVLDSVLNADAARIKWTLETINRNDFAEAVRKISEAHRIYIIGMRSASILAEFLAINFRYMFDNVTLLQTTSGSEVFDQLIRVGENDVLIAISFPRYSQSTVSAVEFAKKRGAYVVAVSDGETSPIAVNADAKLYARSDINSFVDSLVAPLSIIDALIASIASKRREELSEVFSELETIWNEFGVYNFDSDKS